MNKCLLKDLAKIGISNVDKKTNDNEIKVKLCNFMDVYENWEITEETYNKLMDATASRKEVEKYSLRKGMLAITKDSETREDIGMSTLISATFENVVLGYHTALIIPDNNKVNSGYLNAYLKSNMARKYFSNSASGSGQRYTLTLDILENLPVYLPDLKTQEKIGNVFSHINQKIETNNKIIAELEALAKTIYDYWFVQFDFPDENGNPYRTSDGEMVYNETLKREIPKGWKIDKIRNCIKSINTGLNPRNNFVLNNGDIKYITVKNLNSDGTISFSDCDTVDEKARLIIHSRSDISEGDILFASILPLGRCHILQSSPKTWDINESVFSIRPNLEKVSSEYLYLYFTSDFFIKKAEQSSAGSIFNGIRINVLEDIDISLPPLSVMRSFTQTTQFLLQLKDQKYNEKLELEALRDFLLPMLMNGQLSFRAQSDSGTVDVT